MLQKCASPQAQTTSLPCPVVMTAPVLNFTVWLVEVTQSSKSRTPMVFLSLSAAQAYAASLRFGQKKIRQATAQIIDTVVEDTTN